MKLTLCQSASMSWYRALIWGSWPDFYCYQTFADMLMSDAIPDERMDLLPDFSRQSFSGTSPAEHITILYGKVLSWISWVEFDEPKKKITLALLLLFCFFCPVINSKLEPPYSGSYQVLSRTEKTLQVLVARQANHIVDQQSQSQSQSHVTTDSQLVLSWCQVHSGTCEQIVFSVSKLLCFFCGAPSLTRGRVCLLSVTDRQGRAGLYIQLDRLLKHSPNCSTTSYIATSCPNYTFRSPRSLT
jgi:hypothetical protein